MTCAIVAEQLASVITCSLDRTIQISNLEYNLNPRVLVGHKKSIFNMDWSHRFKMIASCGMERDIYLWNPFISKSLACLTGHQSPLISVTFNSKDSELISLSSDRCIKIWDIRTLKCMQTLNEKKTYQNDERIGSMTFDHRNDCIVTCSVEPFIYPVCLYLILIAY